MPGPVGCLKVQGHKEQKAPSPGPGRAPAGRAGHRVRARPASQDSASPAAAGAAQCLCPPVLHVTPLGPWGRMPGCRADMLWLVPLARPQHLWKPLAQAPYLRRPAQSQGAFSKLHEARPPDAERNHIHVPWACPERRPSSHWLLTQGDCPTEQTCFSVTRFPPLVPRMSAALTSRVGPRVAKLRHDPGDSSTRASSPAPRTPAPRTPPPSEDAALHLPAGRPHGVPCRTTRDPPPSVGRG